MKKITMFTIASCPYCRNALYLMDELFDQDPRYKSLEIEKIDELRHPEISRKYDYYYVPTFYVDGKKLHEGVPNKEKIKRVFDAALED